MTDSTKNKLQDGVFAITRKSLKGKSITKRTNPLYGGHDEIIFKISGSDTVEFLFDTSDFGKVVNSLNISITTQTMHSNNVKEERFSDKDFVQKMYNLFLNREAAIYKQQQDAIKAGFVENLKNNLK